MGKGSPPRMRGLRIVIIVSTTGGGITPAHAGLTHGVLPDGLLPWDRPRACGAYFPIRPGPGVGEGSPPRMRGLRWPRLRAW